MARLAGVGDFWKVADDDAVLTRSGKGLSLNVMPGRMGVPKDVTSGYEKFEAPDPAEWTARGYAVINIDSRGSWDSEGYLWLVQPSYTYILLS